MKTDFGARYDFQGKKILVSGGSSGIGAAVVEQTAASGADVYYLSRRPNPSSKGQHIKADLGDMKSLVSVCERIKDLHVDILINAAAINFARSHDQISLDEWDEVNRVNVTSVFALCNAVLGNMKQKNYGKIVNISSIAGRHRSIVSGLHYVTSKAALIGLTKQLAYEVGKFNINVNVVCPSQTKTEMYFQTMTEEKEQELLKGIPLRRVASVEDQVGPILFLCSDASGYMTGSVLDVNGGQI